MFAALVLVAACQPTVSTSLDSTPPVRASTSVGTNLAIYAAASLKGALEGLKVAYAAGHPGATLTIATDSSAALETQIEQGAPVDVFLSADVTNPRRLVDGGLADGSAVRFAENVLAIVVPSANPARLTSPADLARSGVKVIAAGNGVPITAYATELVGRLARLPGYPPDFIAAYAANVVTREENVKAVIAKVELGEGDAGIVYATDAVASSKVSMIAIPAEANVPAEYAGLVVKGSPNVAAAHAFLDWMAGPEARSILTRLGFRAASP